MKKLVKGRKDALSPEIYRTGVLQQVGPMLELFNQDDYFKVPEGEKLIDFFQGPTGIKYSVQPQFIYPLAYFYKTRFPGNRYYMDPKVLSTVLALGEHICRQIDVSARDIDAEMKGEISQRVMQFWLEAYGLVKADLPATTCHKWEAAMKLALHPLAEHLEGYMSQSCFNDYSFGTGPNHTILYAVAVFLGGRLLNQPAWCKLAERFTDRFVASQQPEGYWAEHGGTVTIYNSVSVAGVARMAALLHKKTYKEALARAWRYFETISYPDFTCVGLVDRRCHHSKTQFLWGYFGFGYWPEGRAFAVEAARARLVLGELSYAEDFPRWLENYVHFQRGAIPQTYKHWTGWRRLKATGGMSGMTGFLRKNGWQASFCVNPVVCTQSCFGLDYNNVFSLWHQSTGRIVSCSQDKYRPEHGSFYIPGEKKLGTLVAGRIDDLAHPPSLIAIYDDGFYGRISVDLASRSEARLTIAQLRPSQGGTVYFNLPLCAGIGEEIRIGEKCLQLTAKDIKLPVPAGANLCLGNGRILLRADAQGTLYFPCLPYNNYNMKDHTSELSEAFLRWDFPLQGSRPIHIDVKILAKPASGKGSAV